MSGRVEFSSNIDKLLIGVLAKWKRPLERKFRIAQIG
jgi:hypothetical protein